MEYPVHVQTSETAPVWTNEKHVHFLNTMEASFVRTMLHRCHFLRLDRHLPDSSESTLDLKLKPHCTRPKRRAPSDSMGPRARLESRRTRRRSSQLHNSSQEQVVPQLENGREGAACCIVGGDGKDQ